MTLGQRLKELRTEKGLSVRDAAEKLGKSAGYISRIEVRGEIPSPEFLVVIATQYGVDLDELLTLSKTDQLTRTGLEIDARNETALTLYRKGKQ